MDLVEAYGRVLLALKTVDIKLTTLFSLKLLTCNLYYNVHLSRFMYWNIISECKYTHNNLTNNTSARFFSSPALWHDSRTADVAGTGRRKRLWRETY